MLQPTAAPRSAILTFLGAAAQRRSPVIVLDYVILADEGALDLPFVSTRQLSCISRALIPANSRGISISALLLPGMGRMPAGGTSALGSEDDGNDAPGGLVVHRGLAPWLVVAHGNQILIL